MPNRRRQRKMYAGRTAAHTLARVSVANLSRCKSNPWILPEVRTVFAARFEFLYLPLFFLKIYEASITRFINVDNILSL